MPSLSTHVLDAAGGGPRPGVRVTLSRTDDSNPGDSNPGDGSPGDSGAPGRDPDGGIASKDTDATGRIADLASGLEPGTYRISWALDGDFVVEVSVAVRLSEERHYHVPLLASPVAAVTYLGA